MNLACPSCGFLTIEDNTYGTYTICTICGWEDDQVQLANPCTNGGANGKSLYNRQINSLNKWPLNIKEFKKIKRCEKWRPLNNEEIEKYNIQTKKQSWSNKGILYMSEVYWNKNS